MTTTEVAVVGAGPYGLSIAAHLHGAGISFKAFGSPMEMWRGHMPKGMLLKSDGFASNLSDPTGEFTLKKFCESRDIPYDDTELPVPLETFIDYGLAFQKRFIPTLDTRGVISIDREEGRFRLRLEDGEEVAAARVVLAVGVLPFAFIPPEFAGLPAEFVTHSSAHWNMESFRGKKVAVIGGGASAVDTSVLLHEGGADVSLVTRRAKISFHQKSPPPTLWDRVRRPRTGIGPSWYSVFFCKAPLLFRLLPESKRLHIVKVFLGPAPGWPMRGRMVGKVPMFLGAREIGAQTEGDGVCLTFQQTNGNKTQLRADHVILATGYKVDLHRLHFLSSGIQSQLRTAESTPILSAEFQSSIPGLYFVGIAAANTFGPLLRFAYGADFTARRLTAHFLRSEARESTKGTQARQGSESGRSEALRKLQSQPNQDGDSGGTGADSAADEGVTLTQ